MALLTSVACNAVHQIELDECGDVVTQPLSQQIPYVFSTLSICLKRYKCGSSTREPSCTALNGVVQGLLHYNTSPFSFTLMICETAVLFFLQSLNQCCVFSNPFKLELRPRASEIGRMSAYVNKVPANASLGCLTLIRIAAMINNAMINIYKTPAT